MSGATILASKALHVYLNHLLQAALSFRERLCSYEAADFINPHGGTTRKLLDELVMYLQESVSKPMSLYVLASRLAVIDRMRDSSSWSLVDDAPCSPSSNAAKLATLSADFLRLSIVSEEQQNVELTADWRFASYLSDMAAKTSPREAGSFLSRSDYTQLNTSPGVIERKCTLCRYIADVLKTCPSIFPDHDKLVMHRYRSRADSLQVISGKLYALRVALEWMTPPSDARLLCLYDLHRELIAYSMAQLSHDRIDPTEAVQLHADREIKLDQITDLRRDLETALPALEECHRLLTDATQRDATDSHAQIASLRERLDVILGELAVTCQEESVESSAGTGFKAMEWLAAASTVLSQQVQTLEQTLQKTVRDAKLIAFYTAEATRVAKVRPYTPYQQRITECWEHAAAAVTNGDADVDYNGVPRHQRFAYLAEGIFASDVTCHTQWERAVERRDDKLADSWQRARERAWEEGCDAVSALLANPNAPFALVERVARGVQMALAAQELLRQTDAHPLAEAEGTLRLLLAESNVMVPEEARNIPQYRASLRATTKQALGVISSIPHVFPSFITQITTSEEVHSVMRWVSRTLGSLTALGQAIVPEGIGHSEESDRLCQSAWYTSTILSAMSGFGRECTSAEVSQRMFLVELTIKSLDATRMHDPDTASWYHLVERAFAATLSDDTQARS